MHTLICVTFSLPPGVGGWLRLLLVVLPVFFFFSVYPFYIVVSKSVLEKVHISIKTDTGSNVPFVTGKTMIELRFRRKKIV